MKKTLFFILIALVPFDSAFASDSGTSDGMKIITKIAELLNGFRDPIVVIAIVIGLALIVKSLYQAATVDLNPGGQKGSKLSIGLTFFIGVILFNIQTFFNISAQTIFQQDYSALSEMPSGGGSNSIAVATFFVMSVAQVAGMIGLIKSFTTALKPEEQGGGFANALKIFIGASLALNIQFFICAIQSSFSGTKISNFIGTLSIAC